MLDQFDTDPQRPESTVARRQVAARVTGTASVGEVLRGYALPNGLQLRQQRVPLGVVGMIYEGRLMSPWMPSG